MVQSSKNYMFLMRVLYFPVNLISKWAIVLALDTKV